MKCSKCEVEMGKGIVTAAGFWIENWPNNWWTKPLIKMGNRMLAWRCPNCKRVEFYTEE